jgi:hypothetical protein
MVAVPKARMMMDGKDPVSGHDVGTRRGIFDYRRLMANRAWEVTLGNGLSFSASITARSRGGHLTLQTRISELGLNCVPLSWLGTFIHSVYI